MKYPFWFFFSLCFLSGPFGSRSHNLISRVGRSFNSGTSVTCDQNNPSASAVCSLDSCSFLDVVFDSVSFGPLSSTLERRVSEFLAALAESRLLRKAWRASAAIRGTTMSTYRAKSSPTTVPLWHRKCWEALVTRTGQPRYQTKKNGIGRHRTVEASSLPRTAEGSTPPPPSPSPKESALWKVSRRKNVHAGTECDPPPWLFWVSSPPVERVDLCPGFDLLGVEAAAEETAARLGGTDTVLRCGLANCCSLTPAIPGPAPTPDSICPT
mmetsp:Transcript_26691/g.77006  ORF Transcript_26691/g.77006 Transcript_26691/m.77006 type:complete len:268 (+) Transcript_26691:60-863(+)